MYGMRPKVGDITKTRANGRQEPSTSPFLVMRAFPNIKVRPNFLLDEIIQEITRRIIYKDEK
jgi:hypothetical protein